MCSLFFPLIPQNPPCSCMLSFRFFRGINSIVMNVIPSGLASRYFRSVALMCKVIDCLLFIKIIDSNGPLFIILMTSNLYSYDELKYELFRVFLGTIVKDNFFNSNLHAQLANFNVNIKYNSLWVWLNFLCD